MIVRIHKVIYILATLLAINYPSALPASEAKHRNVTIAGQPQTFSITTSPTGETYLLSKSWDAPQDIICNFLVLPSKKSLYLSHLFPQGPKGQGTALVEFMITIALENGVEKINFRSGHGSWGFYYKLGFRPYLCNSGPLFGVYSKSSGTDHRMNVAMALDLKLKLPQKVTAKKLREDQALQDALTYLNENYQSPEDDLLGRNMGLVKRTLEAINYPPQQAEPRKRGEGSVHMEMDKDTICRFDELLPWPSQDKSALRYLGDQLTEEETYEGFLNLPIPDYKKLVDTFAKEKKLVRVQGTGNATGKKPAVPDPDRTILMMTKALNRNH